MNWYQKVFQRKHATPYSSRFIPLCSNLNVIFSDFLLYRFHPQNTRNVIYWYFYSFPFHLPYKINNYVCNWEFLGLICVSMAVAGIIIIIIIIIIINIAILVITFVQGIYDYIPETKHVARV